MPTWNVVSVASNIAGAGTALAGLILVYLGAVAVRYETLDSKAQAAARDVYRMIAKLLNLEPYSSMIAAMAGIALVISFFIAVMAAYWIRESLD